MPIEITPSEAAFIAAIFLGICQQRSNLVRHTSDIGARYGARDSVVRPPPLWIGISMPPALPYDA
jgi:hypothetical protein